jgi:O-methyltransferase
MSLSPERRYLDLLRRSLVDDLYMENEARLLYVFTCLHGGLPIDPEAVRRIGAAHPELIAKMRTAREDGRPWWTVNLPAPDGSTKVVNMRNVVEFSHSMAGRRRLFNIEECLDRVREDRIPGDLAETGVWRGGATILMRGYLAIYGMEGRDVWVADSFEGLPVPSHPADRGHDFSFSQAPILAVSLDEVRDVFDRYGLLDDRVKFLKGWFKDTLPAAPIAKLALLRLDGDLYESTMDALTALYDKVVPGGFILVDDYGDFEPCRKAVDEFRAARGIADPIGKADWSGVYWRKTN